MRLRSISLLSLLLVFGLVSPSKAAAPVGASQTDPPVYKTHAREVVVDVVVTQRNDAPVNGLRAKDFVVMEDGRPQTVDYFEEHSARTLPPGELKPLPPMPPGVFTNVPPAPSSDAVNVLLMDALNTDKQDQSLRSQPDHGIPEEDAAGDRGLRCLCWVEAAHGAGIHSGTALLCAMR